MSKPTEHQVDTLAAFTNKVEEFLAAALIRQKDSPYHGNWYRGAGMAASYKLEPSLYRHPTVKTVDELIKLERLMLDDFVRQNVLHSSAVHAPVGTDDFRTMFFMQHYGVPTRLLDWTGNPFIALYFALTSAPQDKQGQYKEDAAVWVLDPVAWNHHALAEVSFGDGGPLSLESEETAAYVPRRLVKGSLESSAIKSMYERPVAILGVANNARMFAQRGVFTLFGKVLDPMEAQYDQAIFPQDSLVKLTVPKDAIASLMQRLLQIGFTDSVAYPDLHGLAMEIKRTRGFRM